MGLMKEDLYRVTIRLDQPVLGTQPKNQAVYQQHLSTKIIQEAEKKRKLLERSGDPSELNTLADGTPATPENILARIEQETADTPHMDEARGWTGFLTDAKGKYFSSHMFHGYLKHVAGIYREFPDSNIKQLKSKVTRYVSIVETKVRIPLQPTPEEYMASEDVHPTIIADPSGLVSERPLRTDGPQGPRTALVRSDVVCAGTELTFTIRVLAGAGLREKHILALLEYAKHYQGLGQWRSSGIFGRFSTVSCVRVDEDGKPITVAEEDDNDNGANGKEVKKPARGKAKAKAVEADDDEDDMDE